MFLKEEKARPIENEYLSCPQFFIEAPPLTDHIRDSRDGEKCLYVIHIYEQGNHNNIVMEKCFWCSDIAKGKIKISQLCLGDKCPEILVRKFLREFGSDIDIDERPIRFGSGDPYVKIDSCELNKMMDWKNF